MKQTCLCAVMLAIALGIVILSIRFLSLEDTWICENGQWVVHGFSIQAKPSSNCLPTESLQ